MLTSYKRTLLALSIAGLSLLSTTAQATYSVTRCQQMYGWVWLVPDSACRVISEYPNNNYLAKAGVPNSCFAVYLYLDNMGLLPGTGSAGLTGETMMSLSGVAQTPAIINESGVPAKINEFGLPQTRRFATARSALNLPGGKLFTADAIVLSNDEAESEQLIVTGGTGIYANAKGKFYVQGKTMNNWGRFNGELCTAQ